MRDSANKTFRLYGSPENLLLQRDLVTEELPDELRHDGVGRDERRPRVKPNGQASYHANGPDAKESDIKCHPTVAATYLVKQEAYLEERAITFSSSAHAFKRQLNKIQKSIA